MNIPVYIINLKRSTERYKAVSTYAKAVGLNYQRVEAVEGKSIDISQCQLVDEERFKRCHGKNILPGEVGCYLSHLNTLEIIANSEHLYGVIVEDDVAFPADFSKIVQEMTRFKGWDIIKFANHRHTAFHKYIDVFGDVSIGRFLHGPLGSSAAYIVTREGAAKLLKKLSPMYLPYDVALERGWTGFDVFSTNRNLIEFCGATESSISQGRGDYKKNRLPKWKRIGTLFFRISDYIQRVIYGLLPSHLKKPHSQTK